MSKILVTGAAGFIGSHLADKLIKDGHEVHIIDDLSGGFVENIPLGAIFYQIDLRDAGSTLACINQIKPEIVFHLAANAAENKSLFSPIDITSKNFGAFFNVLVGAIQTKSKRFVFTSSAAVYGTLQTPYKETDTPEPEDLYGISKLASEKSLKLLSSVHGIEYVIARPHNVYGPKQNMKDPYRNVVTLWMNAKLKGEDAVIYGDGEQTRCFSYIDDVIEALYKCGFEDVAGQTFNLGSDRAYKLNDLSKLIGGEYNYLPSRPGEVKDVIPDHSEAKRVLGYKERTSIEEGIKKTWAWCQTKGPQEQIYTDIEIDSDKFPKNWKK